MYDAIIIGGGLVGGVTAIALADKGLKIAVIDRDTKESLLDPTLDGRTTAVSYGSQQILNHLGIWPQIEPEAESILHIKVCEGGTPWGAYYHYDDVADHPMGYIANNLTIRRSIFSRVESMPDAITRMAPAEVLTIERRAGNTSVILKDGITLTAPLVIGAEGKNSPSRQGAGIDTTSFSYDQKALVCLIEHEKPHQGVAWEIFYPEGPVAFLPMRPNLETGAHRSGIVWTQKTATIDQLMAMEESLLLAKLHTQFPYYGELSLTGQRWSYPLIIQAAHRYCAHRYAMVGDAAHAMHPVAGQGVNLGWRDAADLAQILGHAKYTGSDLGSLSVLQTYQRKRRPDMISLLAMTDGIVRLFSNDSTVLRMIRSAGLGIVNNIPPLKRKLMRHAMGI